MSALRKQLLSIRQAYLSTATAPPHYSSTFRKQHPYSDPVHLSKLSNNASEQLYLTNTDRDAIDSNSKLLLRDLSSSLRALADAETLRHRTWQRIHDRKYRKSGLGGLLGRWAAGDADDNDGDEGKSAAQIAQEGKEETLSGFREGVLWYLGRKLESVVETQREMVERRVKREVERGRSVLYMAKTQGGLDANLSGATTNGNMDSFDSPELSLRAGSRPNEKQGKKAQMLEEEEKQNRQAIETQLSPEQLQLFAQENNDMLRHYEDTLDQVRFVTPLPPLSHSQALFLFSPPSSSPSLRSLPQITSQLTPLPKPQHGRKIHPRDLRPPNAIGRESRPSIHTHLPTRHRQRQHGHECRRREQATQAGGGAAEHGAVGVLGQLWSLWRFGGVGFDFLELGKHLRRV